MKITESRLEKDFQSFVKMLPTLDPNSFCGLCRILKVSIHDSEEGFVLEDLEPIHYEKKFSQMTKEEQEEVHKKIDERAKYLEEKLTPREMDEILNDVMDAFLGLNKKRRKEVITLLKDYKRGV